MPRGFLMWMEFHPILVGAGCLVLGYVFGRHGKALNEMQAHLSASPEKSLHTQSQRNCHFEELRCCKCCTSPPVELCTAATCSSRGDILTMRETLIVADETEQKQKTTMPDHDRFNVMEFGPHHLMLNEERLLQPKTLHKTQKSTQMDNEPLCSKGKTAMDCANTLQAIPVERDEDDEDDPSASEPWSQKVLHKRIEYFNYVTSASQTPERGSPDGYRDLRQLNNTFLKVSDGAKGEVSESRNSLNSPKTTSNSGGKVKSLSICGLVPLATPNSVECSSENSPNSQYENSVSEYNVAETGEANANPQTIQTVTSQNGLYRAAGNFNEGCESNSGNGERDAVENLLHSVSNRSEGTEDEVESPTATSPLQVADCHFSSNVVQVVLPESFSTSQAPEHYGRSSAETEVKTEISGDKLVQGEMSPLIHESDFYKRKRSKRNSTKAKSSSPSSLVNFLKLLSFWKRKHSQTMSSPDGVKPQRSSAASQAG